MCVNKNQFFPLVKLKDGKQKIIFDFPFYVEDNKSLLSLAGNKFRNKFELLYLERIKKKIEYDSFVRFVSIPCGHCSECLKNNSKDWAVRIMLESMIQKDNYFLTLTYDEFYNDDQLHKDDLQAFNKKLKTYLSRKNKDSSFRFYSVGEYGLKTFRPHYHGIYYNLPLDDLVFYKIENGNTYYISEFLNSIWQKGFVIVGSVDVASACYVARYCDSKLYINESIEALVEAGYQAPFNLMSRRPGIGAYHYDFIKNKILNNDFNIYLKGQKFSLPFYYLKKMKDKDPILYNKYMSNFNDFNYLQTYINAGTLMNQSISDILFYDEFKKVELGFQKKISIF